MLGKTLESCDAYSFGILLLKLAGGKNRLGKWSTTLKCSIAEWALPLACKGKFSDVVDLKLNKKYVGEELVNNFCSRELISYEQIFERAELAKLDKMEQGYVWIKRRMRTNEEIWKIFPTSQLVPYRPCIQFCKKTRKQLERILDNLKEKLDVATLLMALHRTLEFEDELTEEFGGSFYLVFTGRKDSIQIYNNEAVANVFPELTSILSSFKDPFYQNVVRRRGIFFFYQQVMVDERIARFIMDSTNIVRTQVEAVATNCSYAKEWSYYSKREVNTSILVFILKDKDDLKGWVLM